LRRSGEKIYTGYSQGWNEERAKFGSNRELPINKVDWRGLADLVRIGREWLAD
jgi:hypothetical protein